MRPQGVGPSAASRPRGLLPLTGETVATLLREHPLAEAIRHRRHLEELVVRVELDRVVASGGRIARARANAAP